MESTILYLFENTELTAFEIGKQLKIKTAEIHKVLQKYNYFTVGKTKDVAIRMKKAIDYYIANKDKTLEDVSKKFKVYPDNLSINLRKIGVTITDRARIPKFDQNVFDNIDTEEKAYWLGFMFADGWIQSPNVSQFKYNVGIALSPVDINHLHKFNSFIKCSYNKVRVNKYHQYNKEKERCTWEAANKQLWTSLNKLGCVPRKSLILKFPKIKSKLIRHFIRGYFDGDGSLGCYGKFNQPNCSLVGTKDMLEGIVKQLPFKPTIYHHKGHKEETLTMSLTSSKAVSFAMYLYDNATIYLDRKYNKYLQMCRSWGKLHELSKLKIGEGWNANPEVNTEIKESVSPYSVEIEPAIAE